MAGILNIEKLWMSLLIL